MNILNRLPARLTFAVSALLVALATGCGSGGSGGQDPILGAGGNPQLAPTVTATTPGPNVTGVAIGTSTITATFSKAMDPATLTASSFTLACPAGTPRSGTVSYAGLVATLTLAAPLPALTVCTATITTAAQDTFGHALATNYPWTFTTGAPPDTIRPFVTAVTPLRDATGIATNTRTVTATFSEAMNPASVISSFSLACPTGTAQAGTVTYSGNVATLTLAGNLPASTLCTATITTGAQDLAGNGLAGNYIWSFTTAGGSDLVPPVVLTVSPGNGACLQADATAMFSEDMDAASINASTFTVQLTGPPLGAALAGSIVYDQGSRLATFNPTASLQASTSYTATVTTGARDLAGNTLAVNRVWTFSTGTLPCTAPPPPGLAPNLGTASTFGNLGGTAGTTNTGLLTVVNGDLGSTATVTSAVTGFHDAFDIYTETTANRGLVTGKIYTCTVSTTGPTSVGVNAASCTKATQARLDAQATFNSLSPGVLPGGIDPGAGQLGGLTLAPGVYKASGGSFMITGSDLTLDGQGNANARWVFQTASTLTVGAPAAPRSVILINGAQAKNVFWRVGTSATINGAGGGTMVGTILASSAVSFSTVGNVAIVTLNGRAVALNASVTLTNTVINLPAP